MNDKFLTTKEISEKLNIHPNTVLNLIKEGALKAIKVGDTYRIDPEDFEAYLVASRVTPTKAG